MDYQDSTGNLSRHVKMCEPQDTQEAEMITAFAAGVTYSPARLRFLLAMWVARRHRPFTVVEDPEFQQIVRMLYAKAQLPSHVTLLCDVQAIFAECKGKLIDYLQVSFHQDARLRGVRCTHICTGDSGQDSHMRRQLDLSQRHIVPRGHSTLA